MGKHSAARRTPPREIARLEPATTSRETPKQAQERQRQVRVSPAEMARRRTRRKRVAFGCLAMIVILLLVGAAAAFAYYKSIDHRLEAQGEERNPGLAGILQKVAPREPGQPFYMVLLGEDKRPGELRARSDTLIIAYVDPPNKQVSMVSIPRDTRIRIPDHGTQKINAAMQLGGATLVIDTVKDLTGLPISHYMEVDFAGFKDLVDAIGGVTVDVPREINDKKAGGRTAYHISEGRQKLDGAHALTFVRSRHFVDGDLTRVKDQQLFLKALAKQTMQPENIGRIPGIVNAVVNNVTTDLTVPQLLSLAADFKGMGDGGVKAATIPGEAKYIGGISYFIADKPGLRSLVQRLENGESIEATDTPEANVKAADVSVAVRNGAGTAGLAREVADKLEADEFDIKEVGNTSRPVYDSTLIVVKGEHDDAKARLVHDTLGFGRVVKTASLYQFETDVLVIVGKDWTNRAAKPQED